MKLSEAILLGSVGTEQGFGPSSIYKHSTKRCALGAALFACGLEYEHPKPEELLVEDLTTSFPYVVIMIQWPWTECIISYRIDKVTKWDHIYDIIWKLNDIGRWSRPQIAAWVAEMEKVYDKQEDGLGQQSGAVDLTTSVAANPVSEDAPAHQEVGEHATS